MAQSLLNQILGVGAADDPVDAQGLTDANRVQSGWGGLGQLAATLGAIYSPSTDKSAAYAGFGKVVPTMQAIDQSNNKLRSEQATTLHTGAQTQDTLQDVLGKKNKLQAIQDNQAWAAQNPGATSEQLARRFVAIGGSPQDAAALYGHDVTAQGQKIQMRGQDITAATAKEQHDIERERNRITQTDALSGRWIADAANGGYYNDKTGQHVDELPAQGSPPPVVAPPVPQAPPPGIPVGPASVNQQPTPPPGPNQQPAPPQPILAGTPVPPPQPVPTPVDASGKPVLAGSPQAVDQSQGTPPVPGKDMTKIESYQPKRQADIQMALAGDAPPALMRTPYWRGVFEDAKRIEPDFSPMNSETIKKTRAELAPGGAIGQKSGAASRAVNLLTAARGAMEDQNNDSNNTVNLIRNKVQDNNGDPRLGRVLRFGTEGSRELDNFLAGGASGGGSVSGTEKQREAFPAYGSKDQQQAWLDDTLELMDKAMKERVDYVGRSIGKNTAAGIKAEDKIVSPETKAQMQQLRDNPIPGSTRANELAALKAQDPNAEYRAKPGGGWQKRPRQ